MDTEALLGVSIRKEIVTDVQAVEQMVEQMVSAVENDLGPIDVLVNNAGIKPIRRVVHDYPLG